MEPKPYPRGSNLNPRVKELIDQGALRRLPYQESRGELLTTDGIDIIYDLRNMNPSRFARFIDQLLGAAAYESNRYRELEYRFARFTVELNVSGRASRDRDRPRRLYTAAMRKSTDSMVYGAAGSIATELGGQGKSLLDKGEAILNMLMTGSPGTYVSKQNPFKVLRMTISVRERVSTTMANLKKDLEEASGADMIRIARPSREN